MKRLLLAGAVTGLVLMASAREFIVGIADICKSTERAQIGPHYSAAVYAAGAVPYLLPCTTNEESIAAALDCVDMLLLAGGEDIAPAYFGEKPIEQLGAVNQRRDIWELALIAEARRRRLPILGICRGCQVLNVAFGGTLWQDLPAQKEGVLDHRAGVSGHEIAVVKGSFLESLVGGACSVNTWHHQAVKDLAKGFRATATSSDGVIEAFESDDYPAMGVQFHPEVTVSKTGTKEFLPLFLGAFAKTAEPPAKTRRRKIAVIADYCTKDRLTTARTSVSAIIEKAGFVPVVLPFTENEKNIEAGIRNADALMIGGGLGKDQDYARRCAFENVTLKFAQPRGLPIAGICHGSQIINKFLGGAIAPTPQTADPTKPPQVVHTPAVSTDDNMHAANLVEGSRIARVLGERRVQINSFHTLSSVEMAPGLRVTARADDGIVEAFEHESLPIMAFQFHPELMPDEPRIVALVREALSYPVEKTK